jgi:hypothetical protein
MNGYANSLSEKRVVPLRLQVQAEWARRLKHQLTLHDDEAANDDDIPRGVTVWASAVGLQRTVMTWRWMRVQGIVMLEDPLAITANVQFMNDCGTPVPENKRILILNTMVHDLPWQERINSPQSLPAPTSLVHPAARAPRRAQLGARAY